MHQTSRVFLATLTLMGVLLMVPPIKPASAATVRYVKDGGVASGSCSSWATACTLQYTLSSAVSGDEIWVAAGTYIPHASVRTVSFVLKNGVKVFGGYAGTGSQRDIAAYETILSGDIGLPGNSTDNSYHVVVGDGTDGSAVLDGVTITGGNANDAFSPNNTGGGMLNQMGSPTLKNVTFFGNSATNGGGMFNWLSSPALENVTFSDNSASSTGGGMRNSDSGNVTLTNVTFSGNSANAGGGMINANTSPTLTNVTFSGNSATSGGEGLYNFLNSIPKLINVIIADSGNGHDCLNDATSDINALSSHNLIEASGSSACGLINGVDDNIIGFDPNLGPLADNGGATQTHALLADSPAVDRGTNTGCPATDQRGKSRPQGSLCDIGAFEFGPDVHHVKKLVSGSGDCSTWANACALQIALGKAFGQDEIWVAGGTYTPHVSDRTVSFVLKNNVKVYGGFAGTEAKLEARAITANPTILSGDLAGNDNANVHPNEQSRAENAYHVVVGSGRDSSAVLDGFTITGGNANDSVSPDRLGGGMYNHSGNPTVTNVTFSANSATYGGGMYNNVSSSPTVENVTFSNNTAGYGGGMYNNVSSDPKLTNVTFSTNSATNYGGGMVNSGSSDPKLTNVTFSGNSAPSGGGMYNSGNSHPKLTNVIIANSTGGDCVNVSTTLDAASSHNLMEASGANACGLNNNNGNIIGQDPNLGPLADNGGSTLTHALLPTSPAINRGDNTACPAADQRGVTRPQGGVCDIGSFEIPYLVLPLIRR